MKTIKRSAPPLDLYAHLYRNNQFTDAKLCSDVVEDSTTKLVINCHRVILAAVSPYFRKKFENIPNPKDEIRVRVGHNALTQVLTLIYDGEVKVPATEEEDFFVALRSLNIRHLGKDVETLMNGDSVPDTPAARVLSLYQGRVEAVAVKPDPDSQDKYQSPPATVSQRQPSRVTIPSAKPQPLMNVRSSVTSNTLSQQTGSGTPDRGLHIPAADSESRPVRRANGQALGPIRTAQVPAVEEALRSIVPNVDFSKPPPPITNESFSSNQQNTAVTVSREGILQRTVPNKRPVASATASRHQKSLRMTPTATQGADGKCWLELLHQEYDTTVHALWDKYGRYNLLRVLGTVSKDGSAYLCFADLTRAQQALDDIIAVEPDTQLTPVFKVPNDAKELPAPNRDAAPRRNSYKLTLSNFPETHNESMFTKDLIRNGIDVTRISSVEVQTPGTCVVLFAAEDDARDACRRFDNKRGYDRYLRASVSRF